MSIDGFSTGTQELRRFAPLLMAPERFRPEFAGALDAIPIGMNPKALELQARTNRFATAVINLCERLPKNNVTTEIIPQLIDSSGSTDSNYRATCRARSDAEFISKIGVALEEADESKGWLELLVSSNQVSIEEAAPLIKEANELVSIFVTSQKTAKRNKAERDRLTQETKRMKRSRR